ncbi:hypothetical protein KGY71_06840, partial [Candidatus Bipolaricaulota bacterium]|nr:hypothetical protein [Candidatus Bipolaricaulota bacterium]
IADERGIDSGAYTYDMPPRRYLNDEGPPLLMQPERKVEHLEDFVDRIVLGDFLKVKDFTPEEFVEKVLVERLSVDAVVVGTDWHFGKNRSGSYRDLEILNNGRFSVHPKQQLKRNGRPVSSTWIRQALREGNIKVARELLGRNPDYLGEVVRGHGVGSELGIPTANLDIDDRIVMPKKGSYAAVVEVDGETYRGVVHVGRRPTFEDESGHGIEAHLMEFDGDLYEKELRIEFVKYLDRNRKYHDSGELKRAIENYIEEADRILSERSGEGKLADI